MLPAASSFYSGRAHPSLNFLLPLSLLDPYSDYAGVNSSQNNSSSLSFLNVYASPNRSSLTDSKTDFFSISILFSFRNLCILGDFNCNHPLWDSKGTSDSCGMYSIGSFPLTYFLSMSLIYLLFSIVSPAPLFS